MPQNTIQKAISIVFCLKVGYSPYVNKACLHLPKLCLHFGFQKIELYSTTIYISMLLQYSKLSRYNNQALQEHKMK